MGGGKLETTEEERDLGVIMSRKLKPQSWYLQSFSGSKLHPNLEPDKLGGWSGHGGIYGAAQRGEID